MTARRKKGVVSFGRQGASPGLLVTGLAFSLRVAERQLNLVVRKIVY